MKLLSSPRQYLFNLKTTSSAEALRMWRRNVKEKWNYKCAYCGSGKNLTIDHVVPRCKGGTDFTKNVVCCCHSCNQSKSHSPWEEWYFSQDFFNMKNYILVYWELFTIILKFTIIILHNTNSSRLTNLIL